MIGEIQLLGLGFKTHCFVSEPLFFVKYFNSPHVRSQEIPRISSKSEECTMMKFLYCLSGALFLVSCTSPRISANRYGDVAVNKVVRVCDGDTFVCNIDTYPPLIGKEIRIRIRGVNTPELSSPILEERHKAYEAKVYLARLLKETKQIELRNVARGKYFRIVADVYIDGVSVSDKIRNGGDIIK